MWWHSGNTWLMFGETSTDLRADSVPFNQIYLLAHWKSKRKAPPPDMPTNTVKPSQALLLLRCQCNIYARWSSATPCRELLNMSLQLQQIYLLAKCNCYKHRCCSNKPTGWVLLQDGRLLDRWYSIGMATQSCMFTGVVVIYLPYLLMWCLRISRTCWCGASPQLSLPVWCIIISHACWCGVSL